MSMNFRLEDLEMWSHPPQEAIVTQPHLDGSKKSRIFWGKFLHLTIPENDGLWNAVILKRNELFLSPPTKTA